jgi:hypothetical protein
VHDAEIAHTNTIHWIVLTRDILPTTVFVSSLLVKPIRIDAVDLRDRETAPSAR